MSCIDKIDAMVSSINKLGIPCFLGGRNRGLDETALYPRKPFCRIEAKRLCDFGWSVCDFRLNCGSSLPSGSTIVSINRDLLNYI